VTDIADCRRSYKLRPEDVVVYSRADKLREGEVFSTYASQALRPGVRLLAVYSQEQDTVYFINITPHYPGTEDVSIRIEMALGTRGVFIKPA